MRLRQALGDLRAGFQQPLEVRTLQRRRLRLQRTHTLGEGGTAVRLARHVLAPEFPQRLGGRCRLGAQHIQAVEQLDVADALRERRRARDRINQLAQQRFVVRTAARRQITDVEIDLVPQAARLRELRRLGNIQQRIDQSARYPPERAPLGK